MDGISNVVITGRGKKMPLKPGHSQKTVRENAKEMMESGHKDDRAWAAAYSSARKSARTILGHVPARLKKK